MNIHIYKYLYISVCVSILCIRNDFLFLIQRKQTKFARNASEVFMSAILYAFVAIH